MPLSLHAYFQFKLKFLKFATSVTDSKYTEYE